MFVPIILFFYIYYQLYHHHPLIPTLITFTLPPSSMLKRTAPLPKNSFRPFSPTLFPQPLRSPPILPQPDTRLPLPPSHSSPTDQNTSPTLHNPKPRQPLAQTPSSTTTEIHPNTYKDHKNSSPHTAFPTHLPHFPSPPLVPHYLTPQISIATITNRNPQLPLLIDITPKGSSI
jgi:hypothetical protein